MGEYAILTGGSAGRAATFLGEATTWAANNPVALILVIAGSIIVMLWATNPRL